MTEKHMKNQLAKIADYKQYSFILLSLSAFLSIGLLIPSALVTDWQFPAVITLGILLIAAMTCHRYAMKVEKRLYEEENHK
ncbi:YrhC family protein [Bacillus sp. JCM 19034]|uniref:YrhC family protein n=1 Tax=Bacillus sp. JCM 19034 TaxID=1481928 RepID=UPI000781D6BA|nr:YrhC family protein [Bacillus sp. JCM 19034]